MARTKVIFTHERMSELGRKGGLATKRNKGRRYFSKISKLRKNFRGGRKPKNQPEPVAA